MANFHNAPRPVDDPEHPRRENEPRDEIEMFIRDAYAAGCAAARNPGGALVAFEYANIHAPKLRALLTPSPDHANAGKSVEGDGWQRLEQAARNLIANRFDTYKARNGRKCSIEGDDGEKCWIVSFDDMAELEAALPTPPSSEVA